MRFVTRGTDYAIQSLVYMARAVKKDPRHVVTVDEVVEEEGLPERFLRRILQKLAKKRILHSYKGKSGGFSFLVSPGRLRVTDIIKIFQGEVDLTNCFLKSSLCPDIKKCVLRKRLKKIGLEVNRELSDITIASLL